MGTGRRSAELEEFYAAVVQGKPMFHNGLWGRGTLEVSLAMRESARTRKEIMLSHQMAVPEDWQVSALPFRLHDSLLNGRDGLDRDGGRLSLRRWPELADFRVDLFCE